MEQDPQDTSQDLERNFPSPEVLRRRARINLWLTAGVPPAAGLAFQIWMLAGAFLVEMGWLIFL